MTKVFEVIRLPLQLRKQQQFATKIQQIDMNVSQNIQCLKIFIEHSHQICYKSSKEINKLIVSITKKLNVSNREDNSFSRFLSNLLQLTQCMENQINKIIIFMKSKKYESIKRMNETINIKLKKTGQSVNLFINMVKQYNTLGQKYFKKAQYFKDIEKNSMLYYSFGKNKQKYKEIIRMQEEMQLKLDSITTLKGQIRVMMIQLTVKISEFYQNIRLKVQQFRKAGQTVLQKAIQLIKRFSDKISEASQQDQQSMKLSKSNNENQVEQDIKLSKRKISESSSLKQQIKQIKKEKTADLQRQRAFQENIFSFIQSFQAIVKEAFVELDALQNQSSYRKKFIEERALMVQILPKRCIQDIDMITEVHQFFQSIFYGMQHIVGKLVFTQIFQRKKIYSTRFFQELEKTFELPLDDLPRDQQNAIFNNILKKQKRYTQEHLDWKKNLQKLFDNMINRIKFQFMKKSTMKSVDKQDRKSELFSQKSFEILKADYFSSGQSGIELLPFVKSDNIINYEKITKSDRIKNIVFEIEEDRIKTTENFSERQIKKVKSKSSCCGLFRKVIKDQDKKQDGDLGKKLKNSKVVDGYTCALKNGLMLFQGKLTIFTDYLRFKSSFNPNTFFGSTEIYIPKYDIYEIMRGKHIMSLMITIVTKRGSIQFTSFFSDPFDILMQTYMNNKKTQYEAATCQHMADQKTELDELKQKMKKQFVQMATKQNFKINNINVKEEQNQIEIEYNYNDLDSKDGKINSSIYNLMIPMIFRITVKHYQNSLEYDFWHCQSQNKKRRKNLQNIAIQLINQDRVQKFDNFTKEAKQRDNMDDNISFNMGEQFSIISSMQKHQLDFGQSDLAMNFPKYDSGKKNISNLDMLMMENETKNHSQYLSPKIGKKKIIQEPKENILQQLQKEEKPLEKQPLEKQKRLSSRKSEREIFQRSRYVLQSNTKTNSVLKEKVSQNISVSSNASTVKYPERPRRIIDESPSTKMEQSSKQGMKNLLLLLGIAYGLMCIIKLFL